MLEAIRSDMATDPDIDRLSTKSRGMPGQLFRMEPAHARRTIRKTSVDGQARALLELVAAGNQRAYEELYRLLSRRVYAFARRLIENAELADEIMADTMYEVWRTAARYRGDSAVTTWVLAIARNKALMMVRSRPKATHESIEDFADIIESGAPDGFALLARKQMREVILRCIQGLSGKHRECIHLTYFEDMSMREIAAMLDIPEGTVKSRLSKARAQLAASVSAMIQPAAAA